MKKKTDKRSIFENKRVVLILSFVLGFLCWLIVAGFVNNSTERSIANIRINYANRADDYTRHDLQIVTDLSNLELAAVRVQGDATLISGFTNTDITVYPDYSAVYEPGTYTIPLKAEKVTSGSYNILEWSVQNSEHSLRSPATTIELTFETVETKTFPITVQSDGVTAASGYFKDDPVPGVAEATVTGPTSEMAKVGGIVANVDLDEERDTSLNYTAALQIVDTNGEVIESDKLTIGPSDTVEIQIPILELRTVGLTADIIGAQQGFDMEWLMERLTLSTESIQVVGATGTLANLEDPYPVAEFDIAELGMNWKSEELEIELPEGVRSQDSPKSVTASFDSTDLVQKTFEVTNINVRNAPANTTIEPTSTSVTVTLIGQADQIDALLPENISIEVDAFSISTSRGGQQTIPGRVVIPSANRVFATGSYPIICDIEVD